MLLYDLHLTLKITEQVKPNMKVTHSYYTQVEAFSVIGGLEKSIRKDGRGNVGEADVMSEFYQARQFGNVTIQKLINRETLIINRIYRQKLSFELTFGVQSLRHSSRFRSLQLDAKNGRLAEPPKRDARCEALTIKFSEAKIFYWHERERGYAPVVVREEI